MLALVMMALSGGSRSSSLLPFAHLGIDATYVQFKLGTPEKKTGRIPGHKKVAYPMWLNWLALPKFARSSS
jgi:hypothetical protein